MNKCSRFPVRAIVPGVAGARNVKWLCEYFFIRTSTTAPPHVQDGVKKEKNIEKIFFTEIGQLKVKKIFFSLETAATLFTVLSIGV